MKLQKFGSLYVNGQPVAPGRPYCPGDIISFGDTVPGKELSWVPVPHTTSWVARNLILNSISWWQLRDLKLVDGSPFIMDGNVYFMRLPKLGAYPQAKSELALVEVPDDGIFYWGNDIFISFDNRKKPEQRCSVGGGASFHAWSSLHPAERRPDLGFRPVISIGLSKPEFKLPGPQSGR